MVTSDKFRCKFIIQINWPFYRNHLGQIPLVLALLYGNCPLIFKHHFYFSKHSVLFSILIYRCFISFSTRIFDCNFQTFCSCKFISCFKIRTYIIDYWLIDRKKILSISWTTKIVKTMKTIFSCGSKFQKWMGMQEWHQNTRNCKSFLQKFVIVYKTFAVAIITKNLPRTTRFCLWSFCEGVLLDDYFWMVPRVVVLLDPRR